jgi:hypothetical protein
MKKKEDYLALQDIEYMDPKDLIPYAKNARRHGSEIEILCNDIREHKFDKGHAIIVDKNHVIIAGHGRRLAAMKLGMKKVPVIVRDDLDVKQVKSYRLSDNKMSDLGGYDFDILDAELMELEEMGVDMEQFGFEDFSEFEEPESAEVEQIDAPETSSDPPEEPSRTHKLIVICDDSAELQNLYDELTEKGYKCQIQ